MTPNVSAERWLCPSCGATSEPAPEPPPGCPRCDAPLYVGKFGLLSELPSDRSARIFRGRESGGRAEVTVSLFPGDLLPPLGLVRQAIKKAASVSDPSIEFPLDAGTHQDRIYIVEPPATGEPVTKADLTLREAVNVIRTAALALDQAQSHGVVHGDLRAEHLRVSRVAGERLVETAWRLSLRGFGTA